MKNLDVIEQEKQEQEAAGALLSEVQGEDQSQQPHSQADSRPGGQSDPQPGESSGERMFTKEEVRQIVAAAAARERVKQECREYLLVHYYDGMTAVIDELDRVLQVLDPKSVDDLAKKMEDIEALNNEAEAGIATRTTTTPKSIKTSLKQIFGL